MKDNVKAPRFGIHDRKMYLQQVSMLEEMPNPAMARSTFEFETMMANWRDRVLDRCRRAERHYDRYMGRLNKYIPHQGLQERERHKWVYGPTLGRPD